MTRPNEGSHHANIKHSSTLLELYSFGEDHFEKHHILETQELKPFLNQSKHKIWLNVSSIQDLDIIHQLAELFKIHPLVIEDILNIGQRPKIEEFDDYIIIITKMIHTKNGITSIETEQISILFGSNYVISFQETSEDIFDIIRSRLENPAGKMRKLGTDYFAYTLLDTIVDQYYIILELISDAMERIEDNIITRQRSVNLSSIYHHRKTLREVKKNTWPMREVLSYWKRAEHPLFRKKTLAFINDIYEHSIEIMEGLEIQREAMANLTEVYMTQLSMKQNEVMKTLTVIATIFIPLTFIAGVYGMNFKHMPELNWPYGYGTIWLVFLLITGLMIFYFKRKKWF